ncbi:MAG: glycosyltransferase [Lachnospiraceae bacterium]|nr:glycosyltransferase [Lachnospiraceae bacterium]
MKVVVFMSTYNGEKYIYDQINSILNQRNVDVELFIRDDGSKDRTKEILEEWCKKDFRIHCLFGNNLGFQYSFAEVSSANVDADFYAFSDQDDVWFDDRIEHAINQIHHFIGPALYTSNIFVTDSNLNNKKKLYNEKEIDFFREGCKKYSVYCENGYACTMVWNKQLNNVLKSYRHKCKISQDVWTQLVNDLIGGEFVFDEKPTILHRIHDSNTAGIERRKIKKIKKAFKTYISSDITPKNKVVKEAMKGFEDYLFKQSKSFSFLEIVSKSQKGLRNKMKIIRSGVLKGKPLERILFDLLLIVLGRF